jgi:hypothetical protein
MFHRVMYERALWMRVQVIYLKADFVLVAPVIVALKEGHILPGAFAESIDCVRAGSQVLSTKYRFDPVRVAVLIRLDDFCRAIRRTIIADQNFIIARDPLLENTVEGLANKADLIITNDVDT